jgi:hypothetical protein
MRLLSFGEEGLKQKAFGTTKTRRNEVAQRRVAQPPTCPMHPTFPVQTKNQNTKKLRKVMLMNEMRRNNDRLKNLRSYQKKTKNPFKKEEVLKIFYFHKIQKNTGSNYSTSTASPTLANPHSPRSRLVSKYRLW